MIPQETIQQIIGRIDILEIIGSFVPLKRRGANYLGLCPFHNEKTPSFTVSPSKEIYKCFGCGKSGNTITFLMEHEKYSYVEALRWLADKYNVTIEEQEMSPEYKAQLQTADSLYVINNFAKDFFIEQLFQKEDGPNAGLTYLKERGFREHTLHSFDIGYCPDKPDAFTEAALQHQFNKDLLLKSGLVALRNGELRDNYRDRIIFPIHNQSGKISGFGARILKKNEKAPKYINTPENEIYVKSNILYGSWIARQAVSHNDECLLVEGYTDVLALHQAGIENVVASGGTSLTANQLRLIKKMTSHLTLLYDGDAAGISAARRGMDLALQEGLYIKVVFLPPPEDPDSYLQHHGATALKEFIAANKKDFLIQQVESILQEAGNDSGKKADAIKEIAASISKINKAEDFTRQQDYIQKTAQILGVDEGGLHQLVNQYTRENIQRIQKKQAPAEMQRGVIEDSETSETARELNNLLQKEIGYERSVVRCLIEYGEKAWEEEMSVYAYLLDENKLKEFITDEALLKIIDYYQTWLDEGLKPTSKSFLYLEDAASRNLVINLISFPYEISPNWENKYEIKAPSREEKYKLDIASSLQYLYLHRIKRMIMENEEELKGNTDPDKRTLLMQTHLELKKAEKEATRQVETVILK